MADRLGSALNYLESKRQECMVRQVIYSRGSDEVTINATPGRTTSQAMGPLGMVDVEMTDFIITASDILDLHPPKPGDRITMATGDQTQKYEVAGMAGEPAWRWSDPEHRALRVHAKYLGAETVTA